jgi:hypothetical protein
MLLDVDERVFTAGEHLPIFSLLGMIADGRHDWVPTPAAVLAAEEFVTANAPNTPDYQELLTAALAAMSYPAEHDNAVRVTLEELRDLVADLSQAAVILVEDSRNDGSFVRALIETLGAEAHVTALRNYWLVIEHAGGTGRLESRTEEFCARFRRLDRVVVLLDSDRNSPNEQTASHTKKEDLAKKPRVADVHVWEWREVENYVPGTVWRTHFPYKDDQVDALLAMLPKQRGYLDLKKGGWKDSTISSQLAPEVRRSWAKGFPLRGLVLVPERTTLTREDFEELGPDAMAELETFLAMIDRIR